ncbi:FAD/NAD(P)-binding domain-containing protein [Microthyrium microscopicum]|uniref:FAD/NAD(P)-binding domain-containing protein n=1 Tax=Microthyrium microscopicum TaxID=703497 RepID=A0A6A6UCJ3_9PEZI|nr:FAD/NAD(P)-binding domain-containing protein [Microthyrium microscopicum]
MVLLQKAYSTLSIHPQSGSVKKGLKGTVITPKQTPFSCGIKMSRMASDLAASLSSTTRSTKPPTVRKKPTHIGIIGGGVAGLRCAEVLLTSEIRVTILEARDRLGGRLGQTTVDGHLVDLGPNWIHGTKDNPIYELVKETGTAACGFEDTPNLYGRDGIRLKKEESKVVTGLLWEVIGMAFEESNRQDGAIGVEESLRGYLEGNVEAAVRVAVGKMGVTEVSRLVGKEAVVEEDREGLVERLTDLVLAASDIWGAYIGSETKKQSLRYLWLEECLDGENLFCAGTYEKVLETVARPAREGAEVVYGCVVDKIHEKDPNGNGVLVKSTDGREWQFDEVVVTTPLGWLKENLDAFQPRVPDDLKEAVEQLGYGALDKVYISFPEAFWDTSGGQDVALETASHISLTTRRSSVPSIPATVPLSPTISRTEDMPNRSGIHTFMQPNYTTSPFGTNTQEAISLASLPGECAHPTLLFYTSAPTSYLVTAHLANCKSASTTTPFPSAPLEELFMPYISLLPNYDAANPACKPRDILATNWTADALAGHGSYTFFPAGVDRADEHVLRLREGMPERGIWLAGEHTAPFVALGTVTGAWMSGDAVGRRILDGD